MTLQTTSPTDLILIVLNYRRSRKLNVSVHMGQFPSVSPVCVRCKCHIEIIEKESDEPITDPILTIQENKKDKMRLLAEIKELLGKIGSLDEELDEYVTSTTQHQQKIDEFETIVDINKIEEKDKMTFLKLKEEVNSAVVKGLNAKKQLQNLNSQTVVLQGGVEVAKTIRSWGQIFEKAFDVLFGTFNSLASLVKELTTVALVQLKNNCDDLLFVLFTKIPTWKFLFDTLANSKIENEIDAKNFYNIASGYKDGGKKYIEDNGLLVKSINDLHNNKLEIFTKSKVLKQMGVLDSQGIVLTQDSSLAKNITTSNDFKSYIRNRKELLNKYKSVEDFPMEFKEGNLNHAYHYVDVIDVKVEPDSALTGHIVDTYDFNKNEPPLEIRVAREYQRQGKMNGFFSIVRFRVEAKDWQSF